MRKITITGIVLALLVVIGCGSSADSVVKEQISIMNDTADAIEKGKTEAEMEPLKKRMDANKKKFEELKLTKADEEKLKEKYKPEMEKAAKRMMEAMMGKMKDGLKGLGK